MQQFLHRFLLILGCDADPIVHILVQKFPSGERATHPQNRERTRVLLPLIAYLLDHKPIGSGVILIRNVLVVHMIRAFW